MIPDRYVHSVFLLTVWGTLGSLFTLWYGIANLGWFKPF